jgi:hypothetical protein
MGCAAIGPLRTSTAATVTGIAVLNVIILTLRLDFSRAAGFSKIARNVRRQLDNTSGGFFVPRGERATINYSELSIRSAL